MSLYDLPIPVSKKRSQSSFVKALKKKHTASLLVLVIAFSSVFGLGAGTVTGGFLYYKFAQNFEGNLPAPLQRIIERETVVEREYIPQSTQEEKIIEVVKEVSPAVVSIIITKDIPIIERFYVTPFEGFPLRIPQFRQQGTEKRKVGGGTGFIVSPDGLVVTNKHVVLDEDAEYTVFTTDGRSYSATVLARDPFQDIAVMKINQEQRVDQQGNLTFISFPSVKFGNSDTLEIGQTVIAIGNALGEFRNTVSVGVISGLGRTITASGGGFVETLEDVIQTDAAINRGNSGGPLLNLASEVIGINTATVLQAQNIGFAIPVDKVVRDVEQVKTIGKIVYPFLGVRYVLLSGIIAERNNLPVDHGAWIQRGSEGEAAVIPGSAGAASGLLEGDIILEFDGGKVTQENTLAEFIQKYNPGDQVVLKILRDGQELIVNATLQEQS